MTSPRSDETTEYEDVDGWQPRRARAADRLDETIVGPDHPDYPLASDDLEIRASWAGEPKPCGEEDRVRKRHTDRFPWSAICYLIMTKGGSRWRGTGFFISPDTVVTAGHCLYSRRSGPATMVQVIPGRDVDDWPLGFAVGRKFHTPDEWREGHATEFDYGVIKLPDGALGERTGHFELADRSDADLLAAKLNTAGYPGDLAISRAQHYNGGPTEAVYPQRLSYHLDTWEGASGSPIWIKSGDARHVVGIHNYGHCPNKATRINERVLRDLTEWVRR